MKQSMPFQAEVKEILNLMVHSLYSQKEIFLRELISNASDALDKLRFESISHTEWQLGDAERAITLSPDTQNRTLKIEDNGIGMSFDEVVQNIGTIAHSGTKEFLRLKQQAEKPELIGQFGVGFYSSFMVAKRVTLHTQKAGETDGTLWESAGDGEYTISKVPRPGGHGTTITLELRDLEGEDPEDFTQEWTLKSLVKKYSDFISFPVKMNDEVLNSQKALWLRSPSDIKPEEYKEFYHHVTHDWNEPLRTIHFKAEGTQEFAALMFIPKQVPLDYNYQETKYGLSLYIRRVFIMANCEDLLPRYFRFVKGMVDSSDLPLNVSREILQKDSQVVKIQKALVGKVTGLLKDMLQKERAEYEGFWTQFGTSLKEGVVIDRANSEKLSELLLFRTSTNDSWSTLAEYIERMKPEQKSLYYLSGDSQEILKNSPYLERLKAKGFETLFMTDTVDEWLTQELKEFKGKKLVSITSEDLDLDTEAEKKEREEDKKKVQEQFVDLKALIEDTLKEQIKEARVSDRLVDTPTCLVSLSHDPSARMARLMDSMGREALKPKRILEVNLQHPVFEKIKTLPEVRKREWIEILYAQALLNEGSPIENPAKFSRQLSDLLVHASL
jgi:molecular chaperone HtpG